MVGELDEISHLLSGGIRLDIDYTPAMLYQVAKMDGAIVLNAEATKIAWANVQLMPDPTILSSETGTRHRTAERVCKQTDALVIAVSQRREVVSLYVEGAKYILQDIPAVLAKANQGLATLEKYRQRLDEVSFRLTALEFEGRGVLHDALTVLQRAELVTRMAVEVERYIVELGTEGRLIEMQLEETMVGVAADKTALLRDYAVEDSEEGLAAMLQALSGFRTRTSSTSGGWPSCSATTARSTPPTFRSPRAATGCSAGCRGSQSLSSRRSPTSWAGWRRSLRPPMPNSPPSTESARAGPKTSARVCAGSKRSILWTGTCRVDGDWRRRVTKGATDFRAR